MRKDKSGAQKALSNLISNQSSRQQTVRTGMHACQVNSTRSNCVGRSQEGKHTSGWGEGRD